MIHDLDFINISDIRVTVQCQKFCLGHKFLLLYWILIIFHTFANNSTLRHCIEVRSSLKIDLHVLSVTLILHLGRFSCYVHCCYNMILFLLSEELVITQKRKRFLSYVNISILPLNKLTIDKFAKSHEPGQKICLYVSF